MGQKLRFDPDALQGTAGRLAEAMAGIQSRIDALEAEASTLIGSWSGEAADAYRQAQQEWTVSLRNLNAVLGSASRATEASAVRYAAARTKIAERWS
jgi:6 kDa early secretory antigenic target